MCMVNMAGSGSEKKGMHFLQNEKIVDWRSKLMDWKKDMDEMPVNKP